MSPVEKLLARVLDDHDVYTPPGYAWTCCTCGAEFADEVAATDHVAHEQAEVLRGDGLVRAVGEGIEDAALTYLGRDLGTIHRDDIARAALAAIFGSSDE